MGFGIALAALIAWDLYMYLRNRDTLRAKTTETRMLDLMGVLNAEEPRDLEDEGLGTMALTSG
jgi:hypothetical protein